MSILPGQRSKGRALLSMNRSPIHELPTPESDNRSAIPSVRNRVADFVRDKLRLLTVLALLVTLAGYLGTSHWSLELASHFRVQYLVVAAICWAGLLAFRDWRWSMAGLLCVSLNAAVILPWYIGRPQPLPAADATKLRLVLSNVLTSNGNPEGVLGLVQSEAPDVLILQEIDNEWVRNLQELNRSFPHSRIIPRGDNFGIGLWSRLPLTGLEEVILSESEVPSIRAKVEVGGQSLFLLATHPVPPGSRYNSEQRNAQLSAAAALIRNSATPAILIGDLNVTMWSPYYADLIRDSGLVNARKGFGILPSWPTQIPMLKIPLDHCLVSPAIGVTGIRTGKPVGSDHLPLIVDLAIPAKR